MNKAMRKIRRGAKNPLIRRLKRHANLATLFRSYEESPLPGYRQRQAAPVLEQATWVRQDSAGDWAVNASGPIQAQAIPAPRLELGQQRPSSIQAQAYPAGRPKRPSGQTQPAATTEPERRESEPDEMDQKTWHRLQAIYRAHEQKSLSAQDSEGPEEAQPSEPPPVQRKSAERQATVELPEASGAAESTGAKLGARRQDTGQGSESGAGRGAEPDAGENLGSVLQARPLQAAWPVQARRLEPEVQPKPEPKENAIARTEGEPQIQPGDKPGAPAIDDSLLEKTVGQIPSEKQSDSSVELIPPRLPRPQPVSSMEARSAMQASRAVEKDFGDSPLSEPDSPPIPIQRAGNQLYEAEATEFRHLEDEITHAETVISQPTAELDLGRTSPGLARTIQKETGSAFDQQTVSVSKAPGETVPPKLGRTSPVSIQRRVEIPSGDESEPFKGALDPVGDAQPKKLAGPVIERSKSPSPDQGAAMTEPTTQAFVPTEIGPLPADLWDLLDQPHPRGETQAFHSLFAPQQRPANEPEEKSSEPGRTLLQDASSQTAPLNNLASAPDAIQRSLAETSEAQAPTLETPAATGQGNPKADDLNLDELARRVYAEVRLRLEMEWERLRR